MKEITNFIMIDFKVRIGGGFTLKTNTYFFFNY